MRRAASSLVECHAHACGGGPRSVVAKRCHAHACVGMLAVSLRSLSKHGTRLRSLGKHGARPCYLWLGLIVAPLLLSACQGPGPRRHRSRACLCLLPRRSGR